MEQNSDSYFLNLDVTITSNERLDDLVDFFGKRVFVSYNDFIEPDIYCVRMITLSNRIKSSPERYIQFFIELFKTIPKHLQNVWKRRNSLSFDIGIQAGVFPPPYPIEAGRRFNVFFESLNSKTLLKVANLKGSINFTVYPYNPSYSVNKPDQK